MTDLEFSFCRKSLGVAPPAAAIRFVRHALFAALFLLAQMGALSHAAEHLRGDTGSPSGHTCQLCLAAHGIDAPLSAADATLAAHPAAHTRPLYEAFLSSTPAEPSPRARAPPVA